MNEIPKIIHQTWKDSNIPHYLVDLIKTWKTFHQDWEFKFWTDDMNRDFIIRYYPSFTSVYDSYANSIQRVDAVRYFILHKVGGVFIDIDFECFENIEPLLENSSCVFGIEPKEHCKRFKKDIIVCNAFMACNPENTFFKEICEKIESGKIKQRNSFIDILESTGPLMLTEIYENYKDKNKIKLLSPNTIYPLSLAETRRVIMGDIDEEMQYKVDNSYALHYFLGSWCDSVFSSVVH